MLRALGRASRVVVPQDRAPLSSYLGWAAELVDPELGGADREEALPAVGVPREEVPASAPCLEHLGVAPCCRQT